MSASGPPVPDAPRQPRPMTPGKRGVPPSSSSGVRSRYSFRGTRSPFEHDVHVPEAGPVHVSAGHPEVTLPAVDQSRVPESRNVADAKRLFRELAGSGAQVALEKTLHVAVESLMPGCGPAVKAAYLLAGLADGVWSFCNGHGFDAKVSMVDVGGGYSVGVWIRLFEADPPPTPPIGLGFDWQSGVDWLDAGDVEGAPEGAAYGSAGLPVEHDASPAKRDALDMESLVRRAAERFRATGVCEGSWHPFVIRYLQPGSVVVGSGDGSTPRAGWFQVVVHRNVVAPSTEGHDRCPRCGLDTRGPRGAHRCNGPPSTPQ
jgi:hypothetical protein